MRHEIPTMAVRLGRIAQRKELARLWGTLPFAEIKRRFPFVIWNRKRRHK